MIFNWVFSEVFLCPKGRFSKIQTQMVQTINVKSTDRRLQQRTMYSKAGSCKATPNQIVVSHSSGASCLGTCITCPLLSYFWKITSCAGTFPMEPSTLHSGSCQLLSRSQLHDLKIHLRSKYSNRAVTSLITILIICFLPALMLKSRMGNTFAVA